MLLSEIRNLGWLRFESVYGKRNATGAEEGRSASEAKEMKAGRVRVAGNAGEGGGGCSRTVSWQERTLLMVDARIYALLKWWIHGGSVVDPQWNRGGSVYISGGSYF